MASSVNITDGIRTVYWWTVTDASDELTAETDDMTMPMSDSSATIIMDYNGRKRNVTLTGMMIQGENLGSGTGFIGVTNIGSKVEALNQYWFNSSANGGSGLVLTLPDRKGISGLATWRVAPGPGGVNGLPFQIRFIEGQVYG